MFIIEKINIFKVDCMVYFEVRTDGNFNTQDVINAQVKYLETCNNEIKNELVTMYREMNFPSEKNDHELFLELIETVKDGLTYDYELI